MNKRALIVEDDVNIAELLMLYLEKDGFDVSIAHDGGKGMAMFNELNPDLVLLDVMMPVMAGAALAAVPIIIVFLAFQKYFTKGITMGAVKG